MKGKFFVLGTACAVIAMNFIFATPSGAARATVGSSDVELGPAFMLFRTTPSDGFPLFGDLGLGGGEDGGKGKGNGNNKNDEEGGGGGGTSGGDGSGTVEPCWTLEASEHEFIDKVNNARAHHGRSQLRMDRELSRVANYHSWNMARFNRLYHTPEEKLRERVRNWEILGENVGRGGTVDSLHRAFMASGEHREIVLYRPFNYVGVGVVERDGFMWVTVLFESFQDPGTSMPMPGC